MAARPSWHGAVEALRRAQTARGRAQIGAYALEGVRLHERAVRAGVALRAALVSAALAADPQPRVQALLADLTAAGCPPIVAPDAVLTEFTEGRGLGQIVGLAELPAPVGLPELIAARRPPLALILADIVEPGNVGALIRTAHAAGATAVIAVGVSDPYHPKAVRTAMGSLFKLPVARAPALLPALTTLRELGVQTAAALTAGGTPLPQAAFAPGGVALCLGGEYHGLPAAVRDAFDLAVSIPMPGGVDSYSVNAAAAILLYTAAQAMLRGG